MARSRNIKPGLFHNDLLAELDIADRFFFIGLWTICDYKGCAEYRPKKLKAQIMPYDDVDVEKIAINLEQYGFIRLYSVQGENYLKVVNFTKHQNPHKNERESGSNIPDFQECYSTGRVVAGLDEKPDKIGTTRDNNGTAPADSLLLIPDSLLLIPSPAPEVPKPPKATNCPHDEIIDLYHAILPEMQGVTKSRWAGSASERDLRARWKEDPKHQSLDFWRRFFTAIKKIDWYFAGVGTGDFQNWSADLRWLIKRKNFDNTIDRLRNLK